MSRFTIKDTLLSGLKIIERQQLGDDRGFLARLFCAEELGAAGWNQPVVQINQTLTQEQGTIRGMHYQKPPHAEMKLVTCLHGAIWDVAVDLRHSSPTFLKWHGQELSADNHRALLIPEGFAHGFQTLTDNCEIIYLHSRAYKPDAEVGLNATDPQLSINWPHPVKGLSSRDTQHRMINPQFQGITL
jgi:dTDP-4-dehydrorhamnose 3,5-epimerase